ncbi:MAG TPA: UDP-N-acetylmuramoyl-tripeptide--D-alanyl-D-alanine ligase [Micromonosporaceae bacterium]|nr:UDP-N-acetylmuramoyl-tripeptide--D-alanyl-D-alanine ligase [Micromonosporaceae bacterium]
MIAMSLAEISSTVGGVLVDANPQIRVTGTVEYDSRKVTPGGLFVAFAGEHVDGHDFAHAAVAAGAVGVLGQRAVAGVPCIVVDDPRAALARLARHVVDRLPQTTVIGLTGSSGKTTTKDFIAQLVSRAGPTVAPAGSLNNELGHPYTVLRATDATRFLVLEIGARGGGHVRYLCEVAPPRIGAVLNVGTSHIGEFGSVEAIAAAKGELVESLPADGVAVLNADDPLVRAMASRTAARVVYAGEAPDAEVRADEVVVDDAGRASYTLVTPDGTARVSLPVPGRHQVGNTLVAAAVALAAGLPFPDVADGLAELRVVSARRMDVFERADGVTVIDDSYNANPASMSAALHALAAVGRDRRRIAVLGYMAELGDYERAGHEGVGQLAAELGVDRLIVVGDGAEPIHHGALSVTGWKGTSVAVADQDAAIGELHADLRVGDVVLVKASRYRTWKVADSLRQKLVEAPGPAVGAPARHVTSTGADSPALGQGA